MKNYVYGMLLACLLAGSAANAEETLLDYVVDACASDLEEF